MSLSKKSVNSITINLSSSGSLATLLTVLYGAAILSSSLLGVFVHTYFNALVVILLWHFISILMKQVLLKHSSSVTMAGRASDGSWRLVRANNGESIGFLKGHSFISRYITVLVFSEPWRWLNTAVVVMPDSIGVEQYRRLLASLRTSAITGDS